MCRTKHLVPWVPATRRDYPNIWLISCRRVERMLGLGLLGYYLNDERRPSANLIDCARKKTHFSLCHSVNDFLGRMLPNLTVCLSLVERSTWDVCIYYV
jgi:hypothetical protein